MINKFCFLSIYFALNSFKACFCNVGSFQVYNRFVKIILYFVKNVSNYDTSFKHLILLKKHYELGLGRLRFTTHYVRWI
jgi:hypothetical protein